MTVPIFVICGPSGSGKTSVAQRLSEIERFAYVEGDELHPAANIEKMSNGKPLQDEDRWPWLEKVREHAVELARMPDALGVIITCSSLKQKYRKVLAKANENSNGEISLWFIFLQVSQDELSRRMQNRKGHYMKPDMLQSQLDDLEVPDRSEPYCKLVEANQSLDSTEAAVKKAMSDVMKIVQH